MAKLLVPLVPAFGLLAPAAQAAPPAIERATVRAYASLWNGHALPRLEHFQLRELTPQTIARFRAELEAAGVASGSARSSRSCWHGVPCAEGEQPSETQLVFADLQE